MLFDIYVAESLRKARSFRCSMNSNNDDEDNYAPPLYAPQETMHADDADSLTTNENEKNTITDKTGEILTRDRYTAAK